jgi:hypothetical protein
VNESRFAKFKKNGSLHYINLKRTGNTLPHPARIVISKEYWEDVGGLKGWETTNIYDRTFEDWNYAYAVFDEVLNRADEVITRKS